MYFSVELTTFMSVAAGLLTYHVIPKFRPMFIKANLFGIDLNKSSGDKVPEATGVITGCVFLMTTLVMIPFTYHNYLLEGDTERFPHAEFVQLVAALLSISCMLLLGFADDVLDLRWRHKLLLPSMASLPLLMVYYVTTNRTDIVVPLLLRPVLGTSIHLGFLYYIYMGMLAVFCTNAINILAGINGLEVGQSLVIAASLTAFNLGGRCGPLAHHHDFSLYFLLPYLGTSVALLLHNWFPSRVFPGDTFCYFSGMTFAVVAILGHFSKTLLLFFMPQIFNFLYSVPQLFHFVPCPRHRLPKFVKEDNKVTTSVAVFKAEEVKFLGEVALVAFSLVGLATVRRYKDEQGTSMVECNNFTIINLVLKMCGPMHEQTLTVVLLTIQILCSVLAFCIRYPLAFLLFGEVVA